MSQHDNQETFNYSDFLWGCESACTCGRNHALPHGKVLISEDFDATLAHEFSAKFQKSPVLVISDKNTCSIAGDQVAQYLVGEGIKPEVLVLPGDSTVVDTLVKKIVRKAGNAGLLIAVGSGTVNDLAKASAAKLEIPYQVVATAPSMNGYISNVAAVKVSGVKRTLPARPPETVYVFPEIISSAPQKMRQAGFCDILAKSVSDFDWRTESLLFSHGYCPLPAKMVAREEHGYISSPEGIEKGEAGVNQLLMKALLVSGAAMCAAGSSAPASGGEHLVSHFLDMRASVTGRREHLHGLQVGMGIILSACCYRALAQLDVADLPRNGSRSAEAVEQRIFPVWGKLAPFVKERFNRKKEKLALLDTLLPENFPRLQEIFKQVKPPEFFLDLFKRAGLDMKLKQFQVAPEEFMLACTNSRGIRERLTVLDIADHAGVLKQAGRQALEMMS